MSMDDPGFSHIFPPETLDEVVGPMANRSVVVYGRWRRRMGRKERYLLKEIDLDEDAID